MRRAVLTGFVPLLAAMLLAGGCNQVQVKEAQVDAQRRWYRARATMILSVAKEQLKVGDLDKAGSSAIEALSMDPNNVPARLLLGKVLIEQGSYKAASAELTQACRIEVDNAEAAYLLGVAMEKQGKLVEALDTYLRSYELDDSSLEPIRAACEVMVAMGQVDRARQTVETYLSRADGDAAMYELAGRLADMRGDYAGAAHYYQQALDFDTGNLPYREALGRCLFLSGRYGPAAETLGELTAERDYDPPLWIFTMLGDCHIALNQPRQARAAYKEASERAPQVPALWSKLARAHLASGDHQRAVLSARQALQLDPKLLDASMVLGYALLKGDRAEQAVQALQAARANHPANGTVHCLLGRAHAAAGRPAEARRCYQQALRVEPGNQVARQLLEKQTARIDPAE